MGGHRRHDLGDDVLEIGPGFGATTKVLLDAVPKLTVLEIDPASAELLRAKFGGRADVHEGSQLSVRFRLLHVGDTMNVIDARSLPARLEKAGFEHVQVRARPKERVEFSAVKGS